MPENKNQKNEETVTLRMDQYNALLDRLDELEQKPAGEGAEEGEGYENYESLVQAGQQKQEEEPQGINDMSNEELLGFINTELANNALNPLATQLEGLRLDMEFMRVGGQQGFEDIEEVRNDVLKVIQENPNMSVVKAYKLVRVDNPKPDESETKEEEKGKDLLRHLPERIVSEKPGQSGESSKQKDPDTLIEAAQQAVEEAGIQT